MKKSKQPENTGKKKQRSIQFPIFSTVMAVLVLCGLVVFGWGIGTIVKSALQTRGYHTTEGYFLEADLYSEQEYDTASHSYSAATYRLIYGYTVNGREYTITTDFGTSFVPEAGSIKEIKYNPDDPAQAVIAGPYGQSGLTLIFFGLMFTGIPGMFLLGLVYSPKKGRKSKKHAVNWVNISLGVFMLLISLCALFGITGSYSLSGIIRFYRTSFIFPMVIPPVLIAAGLWMIVQGLLE